MEPHPESKRQRFELDEKGGELTCLTEDICGAREGTLQLPMVTYPDMEEEVNCGHRFATVICKGEEHLHLSRTVFDKLYSQANNKNQLQYSGTPPKIVKDTWSFEVAKKVVQLVVFGSIHYPNKEEFYSLTKIMSELGIDYNFDHPYLGQPLKSIDSQLDLADRLSRLRLDRTDYWRPRSHFVIKPEGGTLLNEPCFLGLLENNTLCVKRGTMPALRLRCQEEDGEEMNASPLVVDVYSNLPTYVAMSLVANSFIPVGESGGNTELEFMAQVPKESHPYLLSKYGDICSAYRDPSSGLAYTQIKAKENEAVAIAAELEKLVPTGTWNLIDNDKPCRLLTMVMRNMNGHFFGRMMHAINETDDSNCKSLSWMRKEGVLFVTLPIPLVKSIVGRATTSQNTLDFTDASSTICFVESSLTDRDSYGRNILID